MVINLFLSLDQVESATKGRAVVPKKATAKPKREYSSSVRGFSLSFFCCHWQRAGACWCRLSLPSAAFAQLLRRCGMSGILHSPLQARLSRGFLCAAAQTQAQKRARTSYLFQLQVAKKWLQRMQSTKYGTVYYNALRYRKLAVMVSGQSLYLMHLMPSASDPPDIRLRLE